MNLNFYVEYHTEFGEELVLNLVSAGSAGKHETTEYRMSTLDGYHWSVQLKSVLKIGTSVDYYYSVMRGDGVVRREWTLETHRLQLVNANASNYHVYDHWTDIPENAYLYSSAMTECVNHHDMASVEPTDYLKTVRLKVRAPQLRSNERLAVVGSDASMGSWKVQNALPMVEHNINEWIVDVDVTRLTDGKLEFKFVVLDEDPDVSPLWESADNRVVVLPEMEEKEVVVYELPEAYFPIYDIKCAGTLVPVFSLRSRDSFGVGEASDHSGDIHRRAAKPPPKFKAPGRFPFKVDNFEMLVGRHQHLPQMEIPVDPLRLEKGGLAWPRNFYFIDVMPAFC